MKLLDLLQGSREWILARATHNTASEASMMMGASKNASRNDLLHIKSTGSEQEFSDWVQANILDKGHEVEALARPIAESIVGEDLYPATATDDDGYLLASFDGVTMMEDVIWEHKQWNAAKAECVSRGEVPPEDHWQVVQQLMVSGAEKCLYMVSDGTEENCVYCWATLDNADAKALLAGWKQFDEDVKGYKKAEYQPAPVADVIDKLPALFMDLTGEVKDTNIATYEQVVTAKIKAVKTDLKTDQDFADADAFVKFFEKAEKEIETVKAQALAKTASIEELFNTVDRLKEQMRNKRLELNKLVTERKKEVKLEIAQAARKLVDDHIAKLDTSLGGAHMPKIVTDFNGVMKGKRTVATLQSAADDEVARAKIEANEVAEKIRANLALFEKVKYAFLFSDKLQLLDKATDDLAALIIARESEHEKAEAERVETERAKIREEEAEKLRREEAAKLAAQQTQPEPEQAAPDMRQPVPQASKSTPVAAAPAGIARNITKAEHELTLYQKGWIDGVSAFAHWKDGTQYVGNGNKTLADVINQFIAQDQAA